MSIIFKKETNQFYLHTQNSTYIIELLDGRIPMHAYWGKPLRDMLPLVTWKSAYVLSQNALDTGLTGDFASSASLTLECPTYGAGDLREPAIHAEYADGSRLTRLEYVGHRLIDGKPPLEGLPASYGTAEEVTTLELELRDSLTQLTVVLQYAVFEKLDAIARSTRVINAGEQSVKLLKVASANVDFYNKEADMLYLEGLWTRERRVKRETIGNSYHRIESRRGTSSHMHSPFMALLSPDTGEERGDAYGFSLVYSGNFEGIADKDAFNKIRVSMGINAFDFSWLLQPGEVFQSPEAVLVYAHDGIGGMSRRYHDFIRRHICRGKFQYESRPVLLNTFEGVYFNFNEEKLLAMAQRAVRIGIDMLVVDDGWFGKRDNDRSSLGDWVCNTDKVKSGLKGLGDTLHSMGLQFGLWFEPEMVSPDSDLYRAHPDWCIHIPGRPRSLSRHQLTLDLSRGEVQEYIIQAVCGILDSAPIDYVKWDMNRYFSEIGSPALPRERQQELPHRYMLGLYHVLETITSRHPNVLFESCASGGGRYDMGLLHYMPQTWCSDDSDAVERVYIQHGTSVLFPAVTMGAHVSACPNHQVERTTPLRMRGHVAMAGQFGYEMDITTLTEEDMTLAKEQVDFYKAHRSTIHFGDMYRLYDPMKAPFAAWQYVSKDGEETILCTYVIASIPNIAAERVKMQGLDAEASYVESETGRVYPGAFLMQVGYAVERRADHVSQMVVFRRV